MSPSPLSAVAKASLEAKLGAVAVSLPSAPRVIMYKVMGKIFAILEIRAVQCVILKCDPYRAEILRQQYAGIGHRSHLDRRFWISVSLDGDVPAEEVDSLITHSYELISAKLTRKQQAELQAM